MSDWGYFMKMSRKNHNTSSFSLIFKTFQRKILKGKITRCSWILLTCTQ